MATFTVFKGSHDGKIVKGETTRNVGSSEVLVKITHSGVCGTDLHYQHADMVLGHEGVGVVEKLGDGVRLLSVGDRVGWGYQHGACGHCRSCLTGNETTCSERQMYGFADLDQGSFGTYAVWDENFLFKIPENIPGELAAPLNCAGVTVFAALVADSIKPTDCVGIVGIGGLGHLAIQFAAKMGCRTVVFSGSSSKRDEALRLGAHEFYDTSTDFKVAHPIDRLLVTTSAQVDWDKFLDVMAPLGAVYPLSVDDGHLKIPYMRFLLNNLRIQASIVGTRQTHKDMLAFASLHNIRPVVEKFEMNETGVAQAMKALSEGKLRYKAVLEVA